MGRIPDILVVEDNRDDFEACQAALEDGGPLSGPIKWCASGEDALDYLHKKGPYRDAGHDLPGLILLDLNLPGLDGRDILNAIKTDPATRFVPVVVMTGSSDPADITRCYTAGANSYLVKPISLTGFIDAIAQLRRYWFQTVVLPELS